MAMKSDGSGNRIPTFANEQEAATFWDSHSPLDYPDEFEEVEVTIDRRTRKRSLTVTLDQSTIDRLASIAREQGIGLSTLARMWILEHLRSLPPKSPPGKAS
jgi:CopG antitoxin of type II toxin-antitoxin system